jgi:hypothetical protein
MYSRGSRGVSSTLLKAGIFTWKQQVYQVNMAQYQVDNAICMHLIALPTPSIHMEDAAVPSLS